MPGLLFTHNKQMLQQLKSQKYMISTDCNSLSVCLSPPPNTHTLERQLILGCRDQFYAFGTISGNSKSFTHQRTRRDF